MAENFKPKKQMGNPSWVKGVSGNPQGRPHNPLRLYVAAHVDPKEITEGVLKIFRMSKNEDTRLNAAVWLRDTGWGKPAQLPALDDPQQKNIMWHVFWTILSDNARDRGLPLPNFEFSQNNLSTTKQTNVDGI